jgi:Ribbon-helix-helix protein, copG family
MTQAKKAPLSRIQRSVKAKRSPAHTVSFRLDDEYLAKIESVAGKRGNSLHEQAREMLMALLDGDEAELMAMRLQIEGLNHKFTDFAAGIADTMEAMLMMNGASEEKARTWVNERLRKNALH